MEWSEALVWAPHLTRRWQDDEEIDSTRGGRGLSWSEAALTRVAPVWFISVFSLRGGLCAARRINATLVLHRNAALMGLCYFTKSTGAVKRLPANPSDPLTTRNGFARAAEPAGRSCCQTLYRKQPQPAIALLRSAEFPPFSQADYIHVVFSLAEAPRGPVLWKWFVEPR